MVVSSTQGTHLLSLVYSKLPKEKVCHILILGSTHFQLLYKYIFMLVHGTKKLLVRSTSVGSDISYCHMQTE